MISIMIIRTFAAFGVAASIAAWCRQRSKEGRMDNELSSYRIIRAIERSNKQKNGVNDISDAFHLACDLILFVAAIALLFYICC